MKNWEHPQTLSNSEEVLSLSGHKNNNLVSNGKKGFTPSEISNMLALYQFILLEQG